MLCLMLTGLHSSLLCLPSENCLFSEEFKGRVSSPHAPYSVRHGHEQVGYTETHECDALL